VRVLLEHYPDPHAIRALGSMGIMDAAPIARQFMRAATSIGANLAAAQEAQSYADFIDKASIALKEARETDYWLRLMVATHRALYARCATIG
jgi:four helix bundle protein